MTQGNAVRGRIIEKLEEKGWLSLADFMETCLYEPEIGYYERGTFQVGRAGDFYTSVSVGPVFGELLASMLVEMLETRLEGEITLLEAGAHDGSLARDILNHVRYYHPEFHRRCRYRILEPSPARRAAQQATLQEHADSCEWESGWDDLSVFQGAVLCNELLDAMPVRSFRWRGRGWAEQGVVLSAGGFQPEERDLSDGDLPGSPLFSRIGTEQPDLPEGFPIEVSESALGWWKSAAGKLEKGLLFTADYGYEDAEWLEGTFPEGTLRGYLNHRQVTDVLEHPGEMDLTAHVNFSDLAEVGEQVGLLTTEMDLQGQVLGRWLRSVETLGRGFPEWSPKRSRQLQTLVFPQFLGSKFRIMIQTTKGLGVRKGT